MALHNIIGNIGVFFVLLAYGLIQLDVLKSSDIRYILLNLVGPFLIIYSLMFDFNQSSFIIQVVWIVIGLVGVFNYIRKRLSSKA